MANAGSLILRSEEVLLERLRSTSDPAEKAALDKQLDELNRFRRRAALADLAEGAAILNSLADELERTVANLKTRPFDTVLGEVQQLFDEIGRGVGMAARSVRLPSAIEAAEPPPVSAQQPSFGLAEAPAAMAPAGGRIDGGDVGTYVALFDSCEIDAGRLGVIDQFYLPHLLRGRPHYEALGNRLRIPWWFIGIIHGMESGFSFETHLHNGDPLTARTALHPAGRPAAGNPPFKWIDSAEDALRLERLDLAESWLLGEVLERFERYNGLGYKNRGLISPYLFSFSNHYSKGKFVADGQFDPDAVSQQCGAAVMLKRLVDTGVVTLEAEGGNVVSSTPQAAGPAAARIGPLALPEFAIEHANAELSFAGEVQPGDKDRGRQLKVRRVQEWCSFHRTATEIDGDFGDGSSDSVRRFQALKNLPATGAVDEMTWLELVAPMRQALAASSIDPAATLYDTVLHVAEQHLAQHPIEFRVKGEDNCGPWVRLYMNGKEGDAQFWCAGFVCFVVGQAAALRGEPMPLKRQVGVDQLVEDAKRDPGRFVGEKEIASAPVREARLRPGCIFVVRKTASDWTHTGIVTSIGKDSFRTIEGNTNDEGSRNGFEVCARSRPYRGKDFILLA